MKPIFKKIIYVGLLCAFFAYGLLAGIYKIFPFPQLLATKHYIQQSVGSFENQDQTQTEAPESVEIHNTFLQRLLVKKIPIEGFSGHGGGITTSGNVLFVVTNKGSFQTYDLVNYSIVENNIPDVPMNFLELIQSGHPYKNDFRIQWFRVNGVYSEKIDNNTQQLFVSHNAYNSVDDCITHNISRILLNTNSGSITQEGNWETIFTATPCIDPEPDLVIASAPYSGHISGGAIRSYNKEKLLVSVGDYNRHGISGVEEYAMDSSNPYGKFLLVDKNTGEWTVFAMGSRNASGIYIDESKTIWSVENGPKGGDELNIITENENYGWPKVSLGIWYDPTLKLPGGEKDGTHHKYKQPSMAWVPSVAPSSIIRVEGEKFDLWKGDLLMGTMRDQSLYRLRPNEDNRIIYEERIPIGSRIRDLIILPDDKLALVTDDAFLLIIDDGGPVFQKMDQIVEEKMTSLDQFDRFIMQANAPVEKAFDNSGKIIFQQNCASCHNLSPNNQIGPHLYDLFDREVGGLSDFDYSRTLKTDSRNWDPNLLKTFLKSPESEFSGIQMQKINLSTTEVDSLVQFFRKQW